MRLKSVTLEGFRGYRTSTTLSINDLTVLVGRNDAGKSSYLDALDIFFNKGRKPELDDVSIGMTEPEISITCCFDELPESVVLDASYSTRLDNEYLLNSNGLLQIKKRYKGRTLKESVYIVANHPANEDCSDLFSLSLAKLKAKAKELNVEILADANQTVKADLRRVIWGYCNDIDGLNLQEQEIEVKSEDVKAIWGELDKHLPVYHLFKSDRTSIDQDSEAQEPLKLAVVEALKEIEDDLDKIFNEVVGQAKSLAEKTVEKLQELDPHLATGLIPEFAEPAWDKLFKPSLRCADEVSANKRGSGFRRLMLLSFFRAKVEQLAEKEGGAQVVLAVEEPETSQHPCHQTMLIKAFQELSENQTHQIILTTHTPALARRVDVNDLRFIDCNEDGCRIVHEAGTYEVLEEITKSLGVLPDTTTKLFIGVEGSNDEAFWCNMSQALEDSGVDVPNLNALSESGEIMFVPLGGSSLQMFGSRLRHLHLPEYHIFDRDDVPGEPAVYQRTADEFNSRENCKAVITPGLEAENLLHSEAIKEAYGENGLVVEVEFNQSDDVPVMIAKAIHEANGENDWGLIDPKTKSKKVSKVKRVLNNKAVAQMTLERLNFSDPDGFVLGVLNDIRVCLYGAPAEKEALLAAS